MKPPRAYCTYFDSRYLARARAMITSLRDVGERDPVYAVCFDEAALSVVREWRHEDVIPLTLGDLEDTYPELLSVKSERSTAEYYFTCTPWVVKYILAQEPDTKSVTYLDADLWFFSPVDSLYNEIGDGPAGIIAHDYLPGYRRLERYGKYNVGWVTFSSSPSGRQLVDWWAEKCLDWCHDTPEPGRYADQGYLDSFSSEDPDVVEIKDRGANLAPWNLGGRSVTLDPDGTVLVDGGPLRFFHFHGLRRRGSRYIASHIEFGARANRTVRENVYRPYVQALSRAETELGIVPADGARRGRGLRGLALKIRRDVFDVVSVTRGESFKA